eukprot:gene6597-8165_t
MKTHKGKDKLKVKVELFIKKVVNLKELNGGSAFIHWRRGSSKSSGETSHVVVRNGEAVFEEKISFESKFFIDPRSQKPDEKKLSLQLKEEKKKASKTLGKIEMDLTSYLNSRPNQVVNVSFTKGLKPEPVLSCTFNTIPLKYNNKPLVKVLQGKDTSKDPRIVRTFGGDDYFLDKTDSDISDTTVDTSVASDMSFQDFSDDDLNDDLGESKKELRKEIDQLTKERDYAENESYERLQQFKEAEQECENLKKQLKILQDDLADKERTIENYQIEKENQINREIEDARNSGDPNSEIEILRQEKIEKMTIISNQEKEISKLKKQIKQSMITNSELGNISSTDLRSKYQSLQQENESQEKLIGQLEREKAELIERLQNGGFSTPTKMRSGSLTGGGSLYDSISSTSSTSSNGSSTNNNNNNGNGVNKPSSGSIEELRRQSSQYKQELDEKVLVERTIFLAEPQFKGNLPVSGINLFDGLVGLGVMKDFKIGTRVFSSINMAFETTFKKCQNDNHLLAYWLSTTCLILAKIKNKTDMESNGANELSSPISSFEYNLKTIIFKFYSKLIQNAYLKLSPVLVRSILQHDIHAFSSGKLVKRKSAPDIPTYNSIVAASGSTSPSTTDHNNGTTPGSPPVAGPGSKKKTNNNNHHTTHNIFNSNTTLDILQEFFEILRQNYVHPNLITQFFSQIFYYLNSLLLNSLNTIKGLCSVANGFQMKIELSKIQDWVSISRLDESIPQLSPMIETTNLLVMDKELLSDPEILEQVCPSVSMYQIKHLLSFFQTDRINNEPIPSSIYRSIDHIIKTRGEEQSPLEYDITYMHPLTLDFLVKDQQYGRERREPVQRSNTSTSNHLSTNNNTNSNLSSQFKR